MSLQKYLEEITGKKIVLTPFDGPGRLPLILCRYHFFSGEFLSGKFIFAYESECSLSPMQYHSQRNELREILHEDIIFVFDTIPSVKRNRLFQVGVPFIVPGSQFFLPPGINFKERGSRRVQSKSILPFPAQLLIIREVLFHDISGVMQRDIAAKTGYSPMSISLAAEALKEKGICELISEKRARLIRFKFKGRELWEKSLPMLRSPVRKVYFSSQLVDQCPLAGISALAEKTMLSPDMIPTFATDAQGLKTLRNFEKTDYGEAAKCILEVWQYRPVTGQDRCVDPCSLYLSLKHDDDPRVEGCLNEMMERVKWCGD